MFQLMVCANANVSFFRGLLFLVVIFSVVVVLVLLVLLVLLVVLITAVTTAVVAVAPDSSRIGLAYGGQVSNAPWFTMHTRRQRTTRVVTCMSRVFRLKM